MRNAAARTLGISLAALLFLAACKTVPPVPVESRPWPERMKDLQARDQFELRGRVAVRAGSEGFNARLRWEQMGEQTLVALDGPLGVGGVNVTANGNAMTVTTSDGRQLDSHAAHTELMARLGFEPPLNSLRYWVLGVPDPSSEFVETLDEQQRLALLLQDGWQISYESYMPANGGWLPQRMTMQREGVRVRVIVDHWSA